MPNHALPGQANEVSVAADTAAYVTTARTATDPTPVPTPTSTATEQQCGGVWYFPAEQTCYNSTNTYLVPVGAQPCVNSANPAEYIAYDPDEYSFAAGVVSPLSS
jgi:hypothetical protein